MVRKNKILNLLIEYGFYLWLFILPWQTRYFLDKGYINYTYWEYGSKVIYATEAILVVLLLIKLIDWILQGEYKKIKIPKQKKILFSLPLAVTTFVVYALLATSWSIAPSLSWYYGMKLLLALGVFWLMTSKQIKNSRMISVVLVGAIFQATLAFSQFLSQYVTASKWLGIAEQEPKILGSSVVENHVSRWLRGYGGFPHPNILGGYMTFMVTLLYLNYLRANKGFSRFKKDKLKIYLAGLMGVMLILVSGLVLSFSRAAWLGLTLVLIALVVTIFTKKYKSWRMAFVPLVVVTAIISSLWGMVYSEPFVTRLSGNEILEVRSNYERLESIVGAKEVIKENAITGIGLGAYTQALVEKTPRYPAWFYQPVHNVYLLVTAELGVIGLILLFWVIVALFYRCQSKSSYILLGLMLFMWLFDHWWWSLNFGWYFTFFIIGLIYRQAQIDEI